jgi:hypothetical protein
LVLEVFAGYSHVCAYLQWTHLPISTLGRKRQEVDTREVRCGFKSTSQARGAVKTMIAAVSKLEQLFYGNPMESVARWFEVSGMVIRNSKGDSANNLPREITK